MKKTFFFSAVAALACLSAVSCSHKITPEEPASKDPQTVRLKLSLGGEYAEVYDSPMKSVQDSLAGLNTLYVLYISSTPDGGSTSKYAYGVFSKLNDVQVEMQTGVTYEICCKAIVDGVNQLYHANELYNGKANVPYYTNVGHLLDSLMYYADAGYYEKEFENSQYIDDGGAYLFSGTSSKYYTKPAIDTYYGEKSIKPTESDKEFTVDMYHAVFEIEANVTGLVEDDKGEFYFGAYNCYGYSGKKLTYDAPYFDQIYTFNGLGYMISYIKDGSGYRESMGVWAYYKTTIGGVEYTTTMIDNKNYDFYRLTKKTFNITVDHEIISNPTCGLGFKYDEENMKDGGSVNASGTIKQ